MNNKQLGNLFVKTIQGRACVKCGKDIDLLVNFTQYRVCGTCTRKLHKEVTK